MKITLGVLSALFLVTASAWAVLGQSVESVHADQQRLHGQIRSIVRQDYSVQQISAADGAVVREYISPAGMVFGIAWDAPTMPNLSKLLGTYFPQFQKASRHAAHRRRGLVVRTDQLVVDSGGHLRAFHGRAYLKDLLPNDVSPAVVQ